MDAAMSVLDAILAAGGVLVAVVGAYWALVVRLVRTDGAIDKETSERQSELKAIGSRVDRVEEDLSKVSETTDKLRRREDFRRGKEAAEKSGVEDMPRKRVHPATDTFIG